MRQLNRPDEALAAMRQVIEHLRFLAEKAPQAAPHRYNLACELALCVPLMGPGKAEPTAQEQAERRRHADEAVEALRQAVAAGFKDLKKLQKDPDLDALRAREDFKQLLAELTEKAKASAK